MQNLTGALPPIYSVHDVMDMMMEAIDKASSEEQKVLIVDKVGMVFNDNGWQSITEGHVHDEDCGCGHDHHHHHDHNCGCGHDHEHHHHDHDHHHH